MNQRVAVAFGLAFDVEKAPDRKSGFKPAPCDQSKKELFADLRLDGFASLLRLGFAGNLWIIGGDEKRYQNEIPATNRAAAIQEMLVQDYGVDSARVRYFKSEPHSVGNVITIRKKMEDEKLDHKKCAVITNLYHLPRVSLDLESENIPIPIYPAEAFWLLEEAERSKRHLIECLGGSRLAERMAEEIQGIADKLRGAYKPLG